MKELLSTETVDALRELVNAVERSFPNWSSGIGQGGYLIHAAKKAIAKDEGRS